MATIDEDSLAAMPVLGLLEGGNDIVKRLRAFDLIDKHFPMLKVIYTAEENQKPVDRRLEERGRDYKRILTCMLNVLNAKRNEYCHLYSGTSKLTGGDINDLGWHLYKFFDAAVNQIKTRKGFTETEVAHLRRKISRGRGEKTIDNPNFFYKLTDHKGLTQHGLAFFTTLFLNRKDSHLFLKQQKGFKRSEEASERATLECFCEMHIIVPKPVIKSDDDENGLALDMLNELMRCPKEMFEIIGKDKQKGFRIKDEDGNEALLMRYSDRFAPFALRYCDDMNAFGYLRFQIDLGKYYFKFYDKDTIDGQQRKRSLDRRLKTFGRLKEVRNMVDEQWKDLTQSPNEINNEENEPFKAASTPHYHIVDNNIKFTTCGDVGLPDLNAVSGTKRAETEGWLSIYELPAMMFYGVVCGFDKVELELKKYIGRQQGTYQKIGASGVIGADANKYIKAKFETDLKNSNTYRARKLERLIVDAKKRLKVLNNQLERSEDIKPGKKNFVDIKAGRVADFLARDILSMQAFDPEKEGKDKITSLNFQVLQSSLAFYGVNRDGMCNMFRKAGVVGGDNPHPFLYRLKPRDYGSIVNFYCAYLNEKVRFLKNCKLCGDLNHQLLRPTRGAYSESEIEVKARVEEFKDKPVNIPTGFFADKIKEYVGDKVALPEKANCAYMIMNYFCVDDKHQAFYDHERTYPIVKKAQDYRKINSRNRDLIPIFTAGSDYAAMDRLIKQIPDAVTFNPENLKANLLKKCGDIKDNERLLRRYKVQDMVTMMMINKILEKNLAGSGELKLKLKDISPKNESEFQKPIDCVIDFKMPFYTAEKHHDSIYVKYIKEANIDYRVEESGKKIVVDYKLNSRQAKLKDVGKYRRYLHDRRLPGLLLWKGLQEIETDAIEKELGAYEDKRLEIAKMIYEIEKAVLKGSVRTENHVPFNSVIAEIVKAMPDLEDECGVLLSIRNGVYHNQYPARCEYIDSRDGELIADKMLAAVREIVGAIMK